MATSISQRLKIYGWKKESEWEFRKEAREIENKKQGERSRKGHRAGLEICHNQPHAMESVPWLFMSDPARWVRIAL